ncbi:MAG: hypothetical protein CL928_03990 [Deltaproteobacteria bacterium]|nr:hypothetical protein [Deltaproteobacteria bacterium]
MDIGSSSSQEVSGTDPARSEAGAEHHGLLAQLCAEPVAGSSFLVGAVRVAEVEATGLLQALPYEPAVFWSPSCEQALCGLGAAAQIKATGSKRFEQVRHELSVLWSKASLSTLAPSAAPMPRVLGGFAFQPGSADTPAWSELGDASFLLPRWTYLRTEQACWLLGVRDLSLGERELTRMASELERILDALAEAHAEDPSATEPQDTTASHLSPQPTEVPPDDWTQQVASILQAIEAGVVQKVVTARSVTMDLGTGASPEALLDALQSHDAASTRFAIRGGGGSFLGATPERLVQKLGNQVSTEALAGTRERGDDQALLQSGKDLREHAFVVGAIERALEPFCDHLDVSAQPQAYPLPHLVHLKSPVRGELQPETHVLELVEALHPTPAVGGVPRDSALAWIANHETTARGWYSAPFGWVDPQGDGEFCVALRCALVTDSTAQLFAGAGIVAGSEANQEFAETEWKLRTLRLAVTQLQATRT